MSKTQTLEETLRVAIWARLDGLMEGKTVDQVVILWEDTERVIRNLDTTWEVYTSTVEIRAWILRHLRSRCPDKFSNWINAQNPEDYYNLRKFFC